MARTLRIGEFAELLGVTTKAIRHYHRIGVLPEPARGENGYRQYGFDSVLHALRIVRLRQIGLPLRDIGTVIAEPPGPGTTTAQLHRLAGDIAREIERLQARRERVLDLIGEADRQDPVDAFSGPSPTMQLILNRLGGALDDAPAELLAQEQRTWEVLDALPGLDTAAWAEGLVNELEADPQWLETMRSMLPELARITDLPPEDPLVTEAARQFVASHDVSTFLDCPSGAGAPVPAAYAAVIQDIVRDHLRAITNALPGARQRPEYGARRGTAMRQALRRHWKTILRIAVISAVAVEGYTSGTNLGIVVAVAEGLLLLLLLIHLPRIATIYRVSRRDHGDRWRAMEGAIAEEAGTRFAKFAMLEAKLWWSLATWLLRRPLPAGSFAYGRNSLAWGLVAVVVVSTPAEVLLFHFLLPWQWLKTLTLILAVYGVFWIVGYAASMSRFPHMVSDRALLVRFGAMDDVVIPWPIISSVEVNRKKFLAGASGVQAGDQPGKRRSSPSTPTTPPSEPIRSAMVQRLP